MEAKLEKRKFVHVVATVDLGSNTAAILYVNPSTVGIVSNDIGNPEVEMSVEDATGAQKQMRHPVVRFASSKPGATPTVGLIQEDIPYEPWMSVVKLFVNGQEAARYVAGPATVSHDDGLAVRGVVPGASPFVVEAPSPARPNRRRLRPSGGMQPREGVTYTVQVKPEGDDAWHTITIGRDTPETEIDRNQFPGASSVRVRVLQTNGFDERALGEQRVDLGD